MDPLHAGREMRASPLRRTARQHRRSLLTLLSASAVAFGSVACTSPATTQPAGATTGAATGAAATSAGSTPAVTPLPSGTPPTTSGDDYWLLAIRQTQVDDGEVTTVISVGPSGAVVEAPAVRPVFAQVMLLWSPDGSRFLARTDEGPAIVTIGPPVEVMTLTPDTYEFTRGAWSPDGRTVVLSRGYPDDARTLELGLAAADGMPVRTLATGAYAGHWSPDGRMIAAQGGGNPGELVIVDPVTGATRPLSAKDMSFLAWSPASSSVLTLADVVQGSNVVTTIAMVSVVDGSVRELVKTDSAWDHGNVRALGWRDDHSLVLARSGLDAETPTTVEVLDTQAGRLEQIADLAVIPIWDVDLAPDGDTLAVARYDRATRQASIWTQAIDGGAPARLTVPSPGGIDAAPAWRPVSGRVDWPSWTGAEQTPSTSPATAGATVHLEVSDAFTFSGDIPTSCSMAADGMRIEQETGEPTVQVGVSADGTVNFLSIGTADFLAFAGKTFTIAPPFVEVGPDASQQGGTLTFHGLPNATGEGTIDGSLTWRCALP